MTLVSATLAVCLTASPSQCETRQLRVEASACGLTKAAEVPLQGEWRPVTVSVVCRRGR